MADYKENVIEWLTGQNEVGFSLTQKKYINRVEMHAKKYPEKCRIYARNPDGSISGHISLSAIKILIIAPKNNAPSGGFTASKKDGEDDWEVEPREEQDE